MCGVAWCGTAWQMAWYDMIRYGMIWYGMVRYGIAWYGMAGAWYDTVRYDMTCHVTWHDMTWHGMVCHGTVWWITILGLPTKRKGRTMSTDNVHATTAKQGNTIFTTVAHHYFIIEYETQQLYQSLTDFGLKPSTTMATMPTLFTSIPSHQHSHDSQNSQSTSQNRQGTWYLVVQHSPSDAGGLNSPKNVMNMSTHVMTMPWICHNHAMTRGDRFTPRTLILIEIRVIFRETKYLGFYI